MAVILKNGKSFNSHGAIERMELKIENGIITETGPELHSGEADEIIDVQGKFISAGLIDLHVHLREPGGEQKETIATGTLAAAKGGFTTVAAMPNTNPVPDTKEQMEWLHERICETAYVRVLPYAAITMRQQGTELTDFAALKQAGAFAFTDDGVGVQSAGMMYEAMKRAAALNMAIVAHCEDNTLTNGGAVHDGEFACRHGLNGIPSVSESVHIARDVLLAEATGCHYHVCHISTKESVRVVRDAKRAGIRVTAEVTPHHLLLCDEDIPGPDANYKMNPPLRSKEDRAALIEGLLDGTIDFIATDHAPHTEAEKQKGMRAAPFGIVGLETAFPLLYTHLVETNILTLKQLIDLLTVKPAECFGLPLGKLAVGARADITVIDLDAEETIDPQTFVSKGKNTPFAGWTCKGWPVMTFVGGKLVWQKGRE
ncbi:dihydroorotase [Parageobacillus thermoglucosidasius]|uniref:Dihydroorotase n=1 Tax=Parageobacillus thermoglucosidasius TaxID=1426 RepID=A0AAN1D6G8_PARTM|nr:dihydroorotase [Parageobacillus thermoglucosidasius]ALF10082.1 dihydroorotase [Parageobacillus thermoglucosidasius]ANZ30164.1 dihydroorotase [Parageobacillus thermoglucosidasius]APM80901.1 dihydroorotase [Parageobacillus thermoglucosidasius]KJX70617.1 dihydroorotase [Parageobacillus thermoglucosidasius]RDE21490.1 dihydroorotase [Parageobacillus thermoglucosidasius]